MARFTMEEAQAIVCIQQLINDWANELDVHNGLQNMGDILTNDCVYQVGGVDRQGRAEVLKFYQDRFARLSAEPGGVPFHRHTLSNLRTTFRSADSAAITFSLVYYSAAGMASGQDHADPALVADVRMDCRRDDDGHWRIAKFDSNPTFRRVLPAK
jgi:hypothetical protein